MTDSTAGISYVVPVYNEEGAIKDTLERLDRALAGTGKTYEILAVNDGSRDRSAEIAGTVNNVRVISHPVNCGYGATIKTGIRNARYDWIGIIDADGTYPIEELPQLVAKMDQGFDMVVACRSNVLALDRPVKKFFRQVFIYVVSLLVGRSVEDPNSGFRLFRKVLPMTFMPFLCNSFSFTTSISVFAFGEGFFVTYVPVEYSKRLGKTKVRHFRDSLRTAQLVIQGGMYFNPVKFAILMSLAFLIFGAIPGAILIAAGSSLGWPYFLTVAMMELLISLGMFCDTLRIATVQAQRGDLGSHPQQSPER